MEALEDPTLQYLLGIESLCSSVCWTMHLYKPACADIPLHKPSLQKPSEVLLKGKKQSVVPRASPPAVGWPGKLSPAAELKQLEKFLHLHGLSLQETVRAKTGMKYRYYCMSLAGLLGGCLFISKQLELQET